MKINKFILFLLFIFLFSSTHFVQAQSVPAAQGASGQEGLRKLEEVDKKLREKIEQKPTVQSNEGAEVETPKAADVPESEKVLIKTISFTGNNVISSQEIAKITKPFEGQSIDLRGMQKIADLITDAYRQKGYITSRAILPPQKVTNNALEIKIIEGVLGQIDIRGNRYFKKRIFLGRIRLKEGDAFNYNELRNDLSLINQYPDRNAKVIITPGQKPGQTDVVLDVKDRLPIHGGFSYDNFGSRYIGKSRFTGTLTDNNLLGFDDILTLQYQGTDAAKYQLNFLRYLFPINNSTDIGIYAGKNKLELGKEFRVLDARGKSNLFGFFADHTLINAQDLKVVANTGFDYKDVFNFQLGSVSSRDRLRVAKIGANVDYSDAWGGRDIFNNEVDFGIPEFIGGLHDVDRRSSRVGAGGQFDKYVVDLLRLQRLPWDSSLLVKTQAQFSSTILAATEQYQLGGIANLRGFASGEAVGDSGQSVTTELSLPFYLIPRRTPVPFSRGKLYDAFRISTFYDWGHVSLRNPQVGEAKSHILDDVGTGLRFSLPEDFTVRLDFAWALSGRPSDDHNEHTWLQVSKDF